MKKFSLFEILKKKYPLVPPEKLYSSVMCGEVRAAGEKVRDPKRLYPADTDISFSEKKYVSRGGFKLEKALDLWKIEVKDKIVLDAGASTGGFTDCLLKRGAALVHAVDSGYNQLDFSLRKDFRVVSHEKTNIMDLSSLSPSADIAVADLSFRSIAGAASKILSLTKEKFLIALIKPQFEERGTVKNFDGVIRSSEDLKKVLFETVKLLRDEKSFIKDIAESPFPGTKGNREFLCLITGSDFTPVDMIFGKIAEMA